MAQPRQLSPAEQRLAEIHHEAVELLEHVRMVLSNAQGWAQEHSEPGNVEQDRLLMVAIGSIQMARGSIENTVTTLGELVGVAD